MSTIGPIGSGVGSAHAQVLKRAQEALQTERPSQEFGDRITNAIDQVATDEHVSAPVPAIEIVHFDNSDRPANSETRPLRSFL